MKNNFIKSFLITVITLMAAAQAAAAPKVSTIRIIRADYCGDGESFTKPGNRIVIIVKGDDNDEVASVKANIEPVGKSPKPSNSAVEVKLSKETSTKDAKRYMLSPLDFAGEIEGAAYNVTLVMLNSKGTQVGNSVVQTVKVDSKGESTCGNGLTVQCVVFNVISARRGLGGTITHMANAIQYAADMSAKIVDTIDINNTFAIDAADGDKASEVWVYYGIINANGKREFIYNQAKLNSKNGLWEVSHHFDANPKAELDLTDGLISIKNPCGEIIWHTIKLNRIIGYGVEGMRIKTLRGMSKNLQDELGKKSTTCSSNFSLSAVNILTTNASGIYTIGIDFQFDSSSSQPDSVVLAVQLENCSGKKQNIAITLKYDSKSGTYVGGQAISQSKDCPWVLTKGEVGAYNACGFLTHWTFKYDETKSNGKGTRVVATTNTGSPGLL